MRFNVSNLQEMGEAVEQYAYASMYQPGEPLILVFQSGDYVSRLRLTEAGIIPEGCDQFGRSTAIEELRAA